MTAWFTILKNDKALLLSYNCIIIVLRFSFHPKLVLWNSQVSREPLTHYYATVLPQGMWVETILLLSFSLQLHLSYYIMNTNRFHCVFHFFRSPNCFAVIFFLYFRYFCTCHFYNILFYISIYNYYLDKCHFTVATW